MSKRFGRNQKRKLREAVAKLKKEADMNNGLAKWHSDKREEVENQFNKLVTAIEQIAPHSVCLPPKTVDIENNYGYIDLGMYPPMPIAAFDDTDGGFTENLTFSVQRLQEFCIDIEDYREKFQTFVHVYTKDRNCNMHYMISNDVLYTMGLPAEELMKKFTHSWRHGDMKNYNEYEKYYGQGRR